MSDRRIRTPRLVLEPVDPRVGRRVVDGDLSVVRAGAGWPHEDSLDGLRFAMELGGDAGWFVTLGGLVIGECATKGGPDPDGAVEIGYGLAAPWRGRGYGRELVAGLSAWLLDRSGVACVVVAEARADNLPSRRALERAGFTLERVEPPHVWYALRRQ